MLFSGTNDLPLRNTPWSVHFKLVILKEKRLRDNLDPLPNWLKALGQMAAGIGASISETVLVQELVSDSRSPSSSVTQVLS